MFSMSLKLLFFILLWSSRFSEIYYYTLERFILPHISRVIFTPNCMRRHFKIYGLYDQLFLNFFYYFRLNEE